MIISTIRHFIWKTQLKHEIFPAAFLSKVTHSRQISMFTLVTNACRNIWSGHMVLIIFPLVLCSFAQFQYFFWNWKFFLVVMYSFIKKWICGCKEFLVYCNMDDCKKFFWELQLHTNLSHVLSPLELKVKAMLLFSESPMSPSILNFHCSF